MKDLTSPKFDIKVVAKSSELELPNKDLSFEAEKPVFLRRSENETKGSTGLFLEFKKAGKRIWVNAANLLDKVQKDSALAAQTFDTETNTYVGNCKIGFNQGRILVLPE